MRKIVAVLLMVALCICLCACGQTEADKVKWDEAAKALAAAAGTKCTVDVSKTAFINAAVNIPESDDFSLFGTRAYHIINAAHEVFANENGFSIRINKETSIKKYQDNGFVYIIATDGGNTFCRYYDNRDETLPYNREVKCETPEQLAKFFPALDLRLKEEHNLTEEELAIWDDVWKKMDDEPDRDEMDIYKELAPTYGMSAEDLDAFIKTLLEKAYQDYQ